MKRPYTKQNRFVLLAVALLLGSVSCSKTEVTELPAAEPEPQQQRIVLTPTRSYEEALTLAQQSIAIVDKPATRALHPRTIRSARGQCVTLPVTRNDESQADTLMYVFNFEDDNGFAIIAANRAVDPVLAVVENGNYTYGETTGVENFDFYMDAMTAGLGGIVKPPIIDTLITIPSFKTVEVDEDRHCDPLVSVKWGQGGVFGAYADNGIAGCVAVAMAQIMAYYQYPNSITTTYPNNGYTQHYGETIALDWPQLIAYPYVYQVSALLREIGQKVGMNYSNPDSSGAARTAALGGFKAFGYSCASSLSNYAITSIRKDLDGKQPVYIRGTDPAEGGHAWVADGYVYTRKGTEYYELRIIDDGFSKPYRDYVKVSSNVITTDLVHYNWGWDGRHDGYFAPIDRCSPDIFNFQGLQMITSIKKAN
ncbi:MAG: C10 family peptidase [Alistipes sp.]|nr:C10 family peptidase [Alistipes sp.]